jgi:predicted nucleotidyltransferase
MPSRFWLSFGAGTVIDLDENTRRKVERLLERLLPDAEVRLVGSRARPGAKRQADIDLLIVRSSPLRPRERALLNTAFEESDIPFRVDIVESACLTPAFRRRLLEGGAPVLRGPTQARRHPTTNGSLVDADSIFGESGAREPHPSKS